MNKILSAILLTATLALAKTFQAVSGNMLNADQNQFRGNRVRAAGNPHGK